MRIARATLAILTILTTAIGVQAAPRPVIVLPVPAFPPAAAFDPGSPAAFAEVSSRPNGITDTDDWLTRHDLPRIHRRAAENEAEMNAAVQQIAGIEGVRLDSDMHWIESGGDTRFLVSGGHREPAASFLVGFDAASGEYRYAFDFRHYAAPPEAQVDLDLYAQEPTWAIEADGVLYVSHRHRGYAADSGGKNGYVTAIDIATGAVLWRSAALVANAATFVLHGDYLVTGYGFTNEADYLYLLRRRDGSVAGRIRLKTGPEYIFEKDGLLHVRCYDTDAVFRALVD